MVFFALLAIIIIGANIGAWYFLVRNKSPLPAAGPTASPTAIMTLSPAGEPTPTPTPVVDESAAIKQAIFKLTGLDATKAEVTISKKTSTHATGSIKEFEAVGGAYWIAAKTETGWICVYDGQANPSCSQIAPYNFPRDLVPECLDANGKVVNR